MNLAFALATAVPLLSLAAIYRLDRYATRSFRNVVMCVAWGIIATRFALFANGLVISSGLVDSATRTGVVAPMIEELAKALILLYLIYSPRFAYFVDGAIYGFGVGIGFAVVENYSYLLRATDSATTLAAGRVLSTNLMHATTTAIAGIVLAIAAFQPSAWRRLVVGLFGLGSAMAFHIGFNTFVNQFGGSVLALYGRAAAYGLGGALVIGLAIRIGLAQARTWIGQSLTGSTGVTAGETQAVEELGGDEDALRAVAARFGEPTAQEVRALLLLEARLGILGRSAARLTEGQKKESAETELLELRREIDQRRRAIGAYAMTYLRMLMPGRNDALWQRLEATDSEPVGGNDLWDRLETRLPAWRELGRFAPGSPLRRWAALAFYAALTLLVWAGPERVGPMLVGSAGGLPAFDVGPADRLGAQIALQWLLSLGFLVVMAGQAQGLWPGIDRRLAERERRSHRRNRLAARTAKLLATLAAIALSAAIWTSPLWAGAAGLPLPGEPLVFQGVAELLVMLSLAAVFGRLTAKLWWVAALAMGAALVYHVVR